MKIDKTIEHFRHAKILHPKQALNRAIHERWTRSRIVTTNGSFDPLHIWHIWMMEQARKQGHVLFVGVDSDASVAEKGEGRPRAPQYERALMVASLACVDYVVLLRGGRNEEPGLSLLQKVQPDIHVNSAEYGPPESWLEWPVMQKWGIRAYSVPRVAR